MSSPSILHTCLALTLLALVAVGTSHADWSVTGFQAVPRIDLRPMDSNMHDSQLHLMSAEVDLRFSVNHDGNEVASFALSPDLATSMTGRARDMHLGNYYSVWNFGVDKPKLKLGQFVVPFGTLAEYDTHTLSLQTPYARTLGIRIDQGLEAEWLSGGRDYRLSLTSGDGRGQQNGSFAAAFRTARDYEVGNDAYRLGLSALLGHGMPVFATHAASLPGTDVPITRADKTRLALDLDWLHVVDNIRGEVVAGWDDSDFVNGQWVSYNHPFSYSTDLTLQADRWQQADGTVVGLGASLHQRLDEFSGLRLAYEPRWASPAGMPQMDHSEVSLQWYRSFQLEF